MVYRFSVDNFTYPQGTGYIVGIYKNQTLTPFGVPFQRTPARSSVLRIFTAAWGATPSSFSELLTFRLAGQKVRLAYPPSVAPA